MFSTLDREMMKAIERFTATVTVPILHEPKAEFVDQVGTGTLFDVDGRLLLITAKHIFEQIDPKDLVIPSANVTDLHGIGEFALHQADEEAIDIAIVELLHPPSIQRARNGWRILSLTDTGSPSREGRFVLSGYPSERGVRSGGLLGGSLLTVHTERLSKTPVHATLPVHDDLDLFFRYDREMETVDGKMHAAPKLQGCSGASIWEYSEPDGMRWWTAEQCLRIVGVQSSFLGKKEYFRGKSWTYVASMIERILAGNTVRTN